MRMKRRMEGKKMAFIITDRRAAIHVLICAALYFSAP